MAKLHIWHRYIGIVAAFFVLILAVTGLLLSRTEQFQLDKHFITNDWLLDRYQIGSNPIVSYRVNGDFLSHAGEYLYLNTKVIMQGINHLSGAIAIDNGFLVATGQELLFFDSKGQLLDEIASHNGLPERPLGLAVSSQGEPVLRGVNTYWRGTTDLMDWHPLQSPHPVWSAPVDTVPAPLQTEITRHGRSHEIHWERFILDLHSGRVMGSAGILVMELSALILIGLSLTGFALWLKRR